MVDENSRLFIQKKLDEGLVPTEVVEKLVQGGWQQAQAAVAVQEVSGVQLAMPTAPGVYAKPPLILRIMFILSFLILIAGIIQGVAAVIIFTQLSDTDYSGIGTFAAVVSGMVAALFIGFFFVIKDMKNGSRRALNLYMVFIGLSIIGNTYISYEAGNGLFTERTWMEAIGGSLGGHLFPILLILYLKKRHDAYFH